MTRQKKIVIPYLTLISWGSNVKLHPFWFVNRKYLSLLHKQVNEGLGRLSRQKYLKVICIFNWFRLNICKYETLGRPWEHPYWPLIVLMNENYFSWTISLQIKVKLSHKTTEKIVWLKIFLLTKYLCKLHPLVGYRLA